MIVAGLHISISTIPIPTSIPTPVTIRCDCAVIGCESFNEGPKARDRGCYDRITELCLGPHDELVLEECRVGSQASGIEACKTEGNSNDQTTEIVRQ